MNNINHPLRQYATDRQWEYFTLADLRGNSHAKVAAALGIDRRAVDRGIAAIYKKATDAGHILDKPNGELKVLVLDIETAPIKAWIWRMWDQVTNIGMIQRDWFIISYAYKWLGNDDVFAKTLGSCDGYKAGDEDDIELVADLHALMNKADVIIAHNGDNFDIKKIKTRMVMNGMTAPAPFRTIDTLKICKREFKFTSNKLDFIAQELLGENKSKHEGINLWFRCLLGDKAAWKEMLEYNAMDVELLERVYLRLRSWDKLHPNLSLTTSSSERSCTVCTSTDVTEVKDSYVYTGSSKFQLYTCNCCGHNMRGRKNLLSKEKNSNGVLNAR